MTKKILRNAIAACALALAFGGAAHAQQAQPAVRHSIVKVAGEVYRFQNNDHHGVFMVTRTGIIVVDPINRGAMEWLKGELAQRYPGKPVKYVLYSHHDFDHASGGAVFANTATYVAQADFAKGIEDGRPAETAKINNPADKNGDGKYQLDEAPAPVKARFQALDANKDGAVSDREMYNDRFGDIRLPDVTYTGKKTITLDGQSVELISIKANHADDNTYVWFPKERVLFAVDVISIKRLPYQTLGGFSEADQYMLIDRAIAMKPAFIVPGHGEIGTVKDLEDYKQYYVDLLNGVKAGIAAGKTLPEIQASLTLDKYKSWGTYEQIRPLNIQGAYAYLTKK
jgi:glyoxylase-like metal-dependent hydrolase (beta-lactamase superfamily II)